MVKKTPQIKEKLNFYRKLSKQKLKTQKKIIGNSKRFRKDIQNLSKYLKNKKLSSTQYNRLKKYGKCIKSFAKNKKTIKSKLVGGFLPALIPILSSLAVPILNEIFK